MKRILGIVLVLIVSAGFLAALTLDDSTITVGVSFDTISASVHSYEANTSFGSKTSGGSAYLFYDVRWGQSNWFSRIGYEFILFKGDYVFKDVSYGKDSGYGRSASKHRGGAYYSYMASKKVGFAIGVSFAEITMRMTDDSAGVKLTNSFISIGLIADCQFYFTERFSARFSLNPDFIFLTLDRFQFNDGNYEMILSQAGLSSGYALGARVGLSYMF